MLKDDVMNMFESDIDDLMKIENYRMPFIEYMNVTDYKNGYYSLNYNGMELWFGTAHEVNAVIKSLIYLKENKGNRYNV